MALRRPRPGDLIEVEQLGRPDLWRRATVVSYHHRPDRRVYCQVEGGGWQSTYYLPYPNSPSWRWP